MQIEDMTRRKIPQCWKKHVRLLAKGKVLDVGTGSGIQAIAAAQSSRVDSVAAVDVQKGVINYCKKI